MAHSFPQVVQGDEVEILIQLAITIKIGGRIACDQNADDLTSVLIADWSSRHADDNRLCQSHHQNLPRVDR